MSKINSIKRKKLELLNQRSLEKIEAKKIEENFIEINEKLNNLYSEIDKSLEENEIDENNELKNFFFNR